MGAIASQITSLAIDISKVRVTGLCAGNSPVTGEFPAHKWPVTREMFPFDDVIMCNIHK